MALRFGRAAASIAAAGTAIAGHALCIEEAPGSDGRRRLQPLPAAAARRLGLSSTPPTAEELAQIMPQPFRHHFASQWGVDRVPAPPAGLVHVRWCGGCMERPHALPSDIRDAVERAAVALGAALEKEGRALGGRRYEAGEGWLVEVVPSPLFYCGTRHRSIILTTGAIAACYPGHPGAPHCRPSTQHPVHPAPNSSSTASGLHSQSTGGQAALLFVLGHEVAHGLAHHTAEKALAYSARMLWFCGRYMAAEWLYTLRCLLAGGGAPHWPAPAQRLSAVESSASSLKLRVAASLQRLSWHHEWEADGVACQLMAAAGVPQARWADGLSMLQHVAAQEQAGTCPPGGVGRSVEAVTSAGAAAEEEEAAAYLAAAARLASQAHDLLAAGDGPAAQQLLDSSLRWPLPVQWLRGMAPAERAQLLARALHTHPPLATRLARVCALAGRDTSGMTHDTRAEAACL